MWIKFFLYSKKREKEKRRAEKSGKTCWRRRKKNHENWVVNSLSAYSAC